MRRIILGLAISLASVAASAAVTLQVNESGLLVGAQGVVIGSAKYDVQFVEGTCRDLFTGCNETDDFQFRNQADATAAAHALLDQVFVDGPSGQFDTNPELIYGCNGYFVGVCDAMIPFAPGVIIMGADTKIDESGDYVRGPVNLGSIDQNSAFFAGSVYALFSPSAVPNPAAMLQQLAADVTGVGPGKSLINKVALAQTYYAVPDVQATCAVLTGFLAEVSAQRDKKIANDLADKLSADAQAIKAAIECK